MWLCRAWGVTPPALSISPIWRPPVLPDRRDRLKLSVNGMTIRLAGKSVLSKATCASNWPFINGKSPPWERCPCQKWYSWYVWIQLLKKPSDPRRTSLVGSRPERKFRHNPVLIKSKHGTKR